MNARPAATGRRRARQSALLLLAMVLGLAYLSVGYYAAERLSAPARHQPEDPGLDPADVSTVGFLSEDGIELAAWWMPAEGAAGTAVLVHGYRGSRGREYVTAAVPIYREAGWNVLALDLRAHGESGGERTSGGRLEVRDVAAALAWLAAEQGVDATEVVLHGWSMGGAVAIPAALDHDLAGLITEGAFADLYETLQVLLPAEGLPRIFLPGVVFMGRHAFGIDAAAVRPVDRLAAADGLPPYLLIHGAEDGVVPVDQGHQLLAAYPAAEGWILPDFGHMVAHEHPEYGVRLTAFLAAVAGENAAPE